MWVKGLIFVGVLVISAGIVHAYNSAVERVEALSAANQILQESARLAQEERDKMGKILAAREATVEVIHETEIKTVEVIKEVQGECLDVAMPADLVARLRDGAAGHLQGGEDLSPSLASEGLSVTEF